MRNKHWPYPLRCITLDVSVSGPLFFHQISSLPTVVPSSNASKCWNGEGRIFLLKYIEKNICWIVWILCIIR